MESKVKKKEKENNNKKQDKGLININFEITREGTLQIINNKSSNKWKNYHFILTGSLILWKKKDSTSFKNSFSVRNAKLEKTTSGIPKNTYGIIITTDQSITIASDKESVIDSWITDLSASITKPQTSVDLKKEQSNMMKAQKKMGSSVATSAAGKKLIKEFLGEEGYSGIKILKCISSGLDGKKKEVRKHKGTVLQIFTVLSNFYTFAYEYNAESIQTHTSKLVEETTNTFAPFFSDKNVVAYKDLQGYITSTRFLDYFYTSEETKEYRKQWYEIIKRGKFIMEVNN